jgi:sulfite exporter TauE/SafE
MDAALIASAALMGLAGAPHCTAMCAAPCVAAMGPAGWRGQAAFHGARVASYALAGGVAAASVGALATLSQASPALRPLWTLLQLAALALGLWLLWQGRQPAWLGRVGLAGGSAPPASPRLPARSTATSPATAPAPSPVLFAVAGPGPGAAVAGRAPAGALRPALAGALWAGWPCGLLHAALLVASMANTAVAGATAMAGFALASSAGLLWGPWLWRRLAAVGGARRAEAWAARLAGLMLVAGSGYALGHGLWHDVAVACGWA